MPFLRNPFTYAGNPEEQILSISLRIYSCHKDTCTTVSLLKKSQNEIRVHQGIDLFY